MTYQVLQTIIALSKSKRHAARLGGHISGLRSDCDECLFEAYLTYLEIERERERNFADTALEGLLTHARVGSRGTDAVRRDRVFRGCPAKPDQAASAKIVTTSLDAAFASGALPCEPEVAATLLYRVIVFLITPGDLPEVGHELPWVRLGRGLGPHGQDLDAAATAALWAATIAAISATPTGLRHLERNVFRHTQNLSAPGLGPSDEMVPEAEAADTEMTRLDRAELRATEWVRCGLGSPDAMCVRAVDMEFGGDGQSLDGSVSAHIRQVDPAAWKAMVARVTRAAGDQPDPPKGG